MDYSIGEYPWKNYLEDDAQDWSRRVLSYVYSDSTLSDGTPSLRPINADLTLDNLDDYINFQLETAIARCPPPPRFKGRLGPKHVMFDVSSNVGSLVIDKDRLGVSSQSNFSSIRANCCILEGKWQYELMLGSKGVMQVGWATVNCKFSQEKGIGDTPDSYSYDGNRVQKWNMVTSKYGEPWLTGDIIGCTVDLDNGKCSFYRNGKWLGEAFDKIRTGPGLAYFPAVSLVLNENLVANFGALPFRYPVPGYSPLEDLPWTEKLKADKLLIWLERFLPFYDQDTDVMNKQMIPEHHGWMHLPERGKKSSMLLLVTPLMQHLGPLLASPYITEACFLPFLFKLCNIEPTAFKELPQMEWIKRNPKIQALLDIMWTLMDTNEIGECLEHLVVSLLIGYRFSQSTVSFYYQNCYLLLTLGVLQHENTCLYLLQNVLFDKTKFPVFLEAKPLDNCVLEEIIPTIWYETGKETICEDELQRKEAYKMSYENLGRRISHLQAIQFQILQQLFRTSFKGEQSCRSIFLQKFSDFLKENSGGSRIPMVHLCPLSVALAFFHHLVKLLRQHLDCLKGMHHCDSFLGKENLFVPTEVFYNGSINYSDIHRVGGLLSHLQKLYQEELKAAIKSRQPEAMDTSERPETRMTEKLETYHFQKAESHSARRDKDDYEVLIELLDGVVRLYVISAHRQLEKMCMVRESMQEYVIALQDVDSRLSSCETEIMPSLLQAREVFTKKLNEQSRHFAWVCAVIYCKDTRDDVYWLLHIVLRTLDQASQSGPFFAFVPDFYVEACIKACNALRSFFTIALPVEELAGWEETLVQFGSFLAHNFANARIVNADLKDSLVQAFAAFVCHPNTLKALENMPLFTQLTMVKALLQPYENRAWAQSNWILVRLWKGCGFAFRYTIPPHLVKRLGVKARQKNEDISNNHHRPCPSPLFQKQVTDWLREHPDSASVFLSSILNQLNWAFSEFIGMLQEIQNATNRPERVFIDSRQLKICATCFDLALALLRVLEMVVHLDPELLTNWVRPSAEILLTRLCQLLCQVLNRVTSRFGCFELVVSMDIPGLETVNHFPILVAVAGILLSLVDNGRSASQERAIKALLAEPSFQPTSLDFLLPEEMEQDGPSDGGGSGSGATTMTTTSTTTTTGECISTREGATSKSYFSLKNYSEVSQEELDQFRRVTSTLHARYKLAQQEESNCVVDEETLCTICYANPKSATFQPCGHQSCRSCISLHLLHQRDCFFCKLTIEGVLSFTGELIYPATAASSLQTQSK